MKGTGNQRLGLTFHRTFPLNRHSVNLIIRKVVDVGGPLSDEELRDTGLGEVQVPAMRRYAVGCGLLTRRGTLTEFGQRAAKADLDLGQPATLWLMHYHLSAPQGPGPLFWHALVTRHLQPGAMVDRQKVARWIARTLQEAGKEEPTERALQSTATVFLGGYANTEGLGALQMVKRTKNGYEVCQPDPPPVWVFAYALADYWEHHYPNQVTINLDSLSEPGGLAKIFWLDAGTLSRYLQTLKQEGVIDLYRVAPPYQVVKLWDNRHTLLERIYDRRSTEDDRAA